LCFYSVSSVPPCVASITCADSFFSSLSLTTNSTVTASTCTSLRSVYVLQGSVTAVSSSLPAPATSAITLLRDETPVPSVQPISAATNLLHAAPVSSQPTVTLDSYSTPASATLFFRSPLPSFTSVQVQDSTSAQPPRFLHQNYTSFESLFPLNLYSLWRLPTPTCQYTSSFSVMDVHTAAGIPGPVPSPTPLGYRGRTGPVDTQDHPHVAGRELHHDLSSLHELLAATLPRYSELLARGSFRPNY